MRIHINIAISNIYIYIYIYRYTHIYTHKKRKACEPLPAALRDDPRAGRSEGGMHAVGNPHRAQISEFEFSSTIFSI